MKISDLNYLETLNEGLEDIAGGSSVNFKKNINIRVDAKFKVKAYVRPRVYGNTALSNGRANAYGYDTFTETYNEANSDDYYSGSYGEATAITV